jgi:1-deoxy-D-xylulose-5-phosphate synthase
MTKTDGFIPTLIVLLVSLFTLQDAYLTRHFAGKYYKSTARNMEPSFPGGPTGPFFGPETTPILDTIKSPKDMKGLDIKQLKQLSNELRWETINAVSGTGGHLGSSLGVVELTVALHHIFDAPEDKIIWDVAHQCYPHKILTGRRDRMNTMRMKDGLAGFTNRNESEYDCFGAGHSSTSISAALGMSAGKIQLDKTTNNCIAVIGDGAITGGMAYEAMNNAAYINTRIVVILNDNGQVSLPTGQPSAGGVVPAGALSKYTARLLTSKPFKNFRDIAKGISSLMPDEMQSINKRVDEYVRGVITGGTLFEELGFYYIGPVDAHDLDNLIPILENIRDNVPITKPVLLHVKSVKGKGYPPAEAASDKYHGVAKYNVTSGIQIKQKSKTISLTDAFAQSLINIAEDDRSVVAITAAMPGGTGIDKFGRRFPKRTYDVGIAEQHAVTFAGGLAVEGVKPFCAIYSTFMQRAIDQMIHDVCLQQLPVRFILDRAGMVGNDGATHHGTFDLAYMGCVPDIVLMAPADEFELQNMVETQYHINRWPSCTRFPRGSGYGKEVLAEMYSEMPEGSGKNVADYKNGVLPHRGEALPIGKGRIVRNYRGDRPELLPPTIKVAILSIGTRLLDSVRAARALEERYSDLGVMVADARFMKPLDEELLRTLCKENDVLVTIEEGSKGGFGAHVLHYISEEGLLDHGDVRFRSMYIPDIWIEHGSQKEQYDEAQLNEPHIIAKIESVVESLRSKSLSATLQSTIHASVRNETSARVVSLAP